MNTVVYITKRCNLSLLATVVSVICPFCNLLITVWISVKSVNKCNKFGLSPVESLLYLFLNQRETKYYCTLIGKHITEISMFIFYISWNELLFYVSANIFFLSLICSTWWKLSLSYFSIHAIDIKEKCTNKK